MEHSHKKHVLGILVLAIVCVAGSQLFFCHHYAPDLFDHITAPVVSLYDTINADIKQWRQQHGQKPATARKEPDIPQTASEPVLRRETDVPHYTVTEFLNLAGSEVLTGGNFTFVYYNQGEAPWADCLFGKDHISKYGCGPTAMSMVVSSMTDNHINPTEMASWAAKAGYWAPQSGSYSGIVSGAAEEYGLRCSSAAGYDAEELCQKLESGGVIVALMGPGHFTKKGHFIVLRGITLTGNILVADPNSRDNSLSPWDPKLILDEVASNTDSGAPLWLISKAAEF